MQQDGAFYAGRNLHYWGDLDREPASACREHVADWQVEVLFQALQNAVILLYA